MADNWSDLVMDPVSGDHFVQVYQDEAFLAEAVAQYVEVGLERDEAAVLISTPAHRDAFLAALASRGAPGREAIERGQLVWLDADRTLERFMQDGVPQWQPFHQSIGGAIAELRLRYPAVRAYGEMVDLLWQRGEREAAIRLEEFWNELASLQSFSLYCAYYLDNLDSGVYAGALQCVCKVHTHLIPARDYERFDRAVIEASEQVLDQPLAKMLFSVCSQRQPATRMPLGQATLLWLKANMPRTADRILSDVRARIGAA
jgi:hypothetical protein